jgi:hypothetical protein
MPIHVLRFCKSVEIVKIRPYVGFYLFELLQVAQDCRVDANAQHVSARGTCLIDVDREVVKRNIFVYVYNIANKGIAC